MEDNRIELMKLLVQRTNSGSLKWEEMDTKGAVKTNIGSSTIVLNDFERFDDEVDVVITVFSGERIVESFSDIDLYNIDGVTSYYAEMKSLLVAARRVASGADQILSDIISALKSTTS